MEQSPKRNSRVKVTRITVPRPQEVLAEHLRDRILSGEMLEGDALPSERELVDQTGLTRGAVRQALQTLSAEGLVRTRYGRFGGSVVTLPGHHTIATAVTRFVKGRKLPLTALQETRELIEPLLARLAAQRRTQDDLRELKELHGRMQRAIDSFPEFSSLNVDWHARVARASHNDLLSALLYSISHGLLIATTAEEYNTLETRREVLHIHSRVNDAIEAQDADAAERRMRQHITATHARRLVIGAASIPLTENE